MEIITEFLSFLIQSLALGIGTLLCIKILEFYDPF